jgi:L-iditol 2-dehydrogenase
MVGLLVLQALKLAGCSRVIGVDLDDAKLALAAEQGASDMLNPSRDDVPARVRELTGGRGADVAMEVVGATQPIQTALASVRKGGTLTLVGNISPKIELPLQSVVTREVRLQGSCASSGEYPECLDLVGRGLIRVDKLISAAAPLAEGPQWFERLYNREPNHMKVLLQP